MVLKIGSQRHNYRAKEKTVGPQPPHLNSATGRWGMAGLSMKMVQGTDRFVKVLHEWVLECVCAHIFYNLKF